MATKPAAPNATVNGQGVRIPPSVVQAEGLHQHAPGQASPAPSPFQPPAVGARPAAAPAPAPSYADLYAQALNQANYGVGQQFGIALADIANREAQAGKMMGGLPAQYNAAFDASQHQMDANTQAASQALQNAGMQVFVNPAAYMAPLQAALSQNRAAYQSDIPTLQGALSAEFGRQRSEVQQAQAAAQAEAAARARAEAHDTAMAMLQHQWDVQGRQEDRRFQLRMAQSQDPWQEKMALQHQYDVDTMQRQQDAEVVDPLTGLTGGQLRHSRSSEAYRNFVSKLQQGRETRQSGPGAWIHGDLSRSTGTREYTPDEIDTLIDKSGLPPAVKNALRYDLLAHATTAGGKSLGG